jgi:hypothetical protein
MGFKNRVIEENDYGMPGAGSSITSKVKDNWGKYLTGAGLGAAAATAAAVGSEDFNDTINNWHDLDDKDQLWNHFMDKGKEGLEYLKGDNSGSGGTNTDALKGIIKGGGVDQGAPSITNMHSGSGGSSHGVNIDKLNTIAMNYAGNPNSSGFDISNGGMFPAHLKSILTDTPDVEVDSLSKSDVARGLISRNNAELQDISNYNQALAQANKDGYISPEEMERLNNLKDKIGDNELSLWDQAQGFIYGDDNIAAERAYEKALGDSIDWAKNHNLHFLLNGNTNDDLAFFNQLEKQFGTVPKELQPIYQAVLRKAQG